MTFNFDAASDGARRPAGHVDSEESLEAPEPVPRRRVVLVGQPNVGKSVVFGALTGTYVTVSNYPGTTVEITRGRASIDAESWEVIDTPGTHNLVPMSEDEAVTRDVLLSEPHDALVQVGDAKSLTRTLLLTLQLAELGIPFCLDLNMFDEARARGLSVDLPLLEQTLTGIRVNASAATQGEGLDGLRAYLAEHPEPPRVERHPLPCAPVFPPDVEAAIDAVEARLDAPAEVAKRGLATMLLAGNRSGATPIDEKWVGRARDVARDHAQALARAHGVPVFALLSRLRLARAQEIARAVVRRTATAEARANAGHVAWGWAAALGTFGALVGTVIYAASRERFAATGAGGDPLADFGALDVGARLVSRRIFEGWGAASFAIFVVAAALGTGVVRRHARLRSGAWKLVGAFVSGWVVYWTSDLVASIVTREHPAWCLQAGAIVALGALAAAAMAGDRRDAAISKRLGRIAIDPVWGLPLVSVALLLAYKVVGVFGAGTAVDLVERRFFGSAVASASLEATTAPPAAGTIDTSDEGASRLVVVREGPMHARVTAEIKKGGAYVPDPNAHIDVYGAATVRATNGASIEVEGALTGAEARVWSGFVNRAAYRFFAWIGVPLLTAFFVGPYGLLTMGVTYAVAIVLPVVTTFFFVFSLLEDSGYLPRLAVMSNRLLRGMGLNGKAVLPMVLGLGCDTMATLTARIMETRKERMLVTLLLALGIPCSSQLSVIFALMQRASPAATLVWVAVVVGTLLGVGWIAARVLPGDRSDFLLEMPPLRQPMIANIATKTMARIEWYLKEAVPLFLLGTALLFVLDALHLLVFVHRAGEPIVHHVLGFPRASAVSDRVSEALLVGFLRRDFGAAGLLDLARAGRLTPADVAVSMVTITLFIPCVANVFMIAKERGWKTAGAMSAFIFPYAVAVGALVRLGFRMLGGS